MCIRNNEKQYWLGSHYLICYIVYRKQITIKKGVEKGNKRVFKIEQHLAWHFVYYGKRQSFKSPSFICSQLIQ